MPIHTKIKNKTHPRPDDAVAVAGENRLWGFAGDGVYAAAVAAERRRGFPGARAHVP